MISLLPLTTQNGDLHRDAVSTSTQLDAFVVIA
jgi:hypothetical protein